MAKKVLIIKVWPAVTDSSPFIRYFQTQAILLLRTHGLLTATEAELALRFLDRALV